MKRKSRLLSMVLTLSLVLTTVLAGAENTFAQTSLLPEDAQTVGVSYADAGMMKAASTDNTIAGNTIAATNLNTGTPDAYKTIAYGRDGIYCPISIPSAGSFKIDIYSLEDTYVYLLDGLDLDAVTLKQVTVPGAVSEEDVYSFTVRVEKGGTYFLVFQTAGYSTAQSAFTIGYIPSKKAGSNTTMTSGKAIYASVGGTSYRYYKITTAGLRYLTISFPWNDQDTSVKYKVKLMDSKKKKNLLKGVVTVGEGRNYVTYAAVPKGTYYVAVSTAEDSSYQIKVSATKVSENSGSTRTKAKRIYKGGTKSGLITATQSSTSGDWYKLVIGSSQTVKLDVITKTGGYNGGIKVSVYSGSSSKAFGTAEYYYGYPESELTLYTSGYGGLLKKGTYYIKVQKYGCGSGYYKIKWK